MGEEESIVFLALPVLFTIFDFASLDFVHRVYSPGVSRILESREIRREDNVDFSKGSGRSLSTGRDEVDRSSRHGLMTRRKPS